jgi:hypothetical protein
MCDLVLWFRLYVAGKMAGMKWLAAYGDGLLVYYGR